MSNASCLGSLSGLATDLSELALADRPPPRKIRRRNAITVQDPYLPLATPPPNNSPVHDAFEDSSRMQALDEIVHRDFVFEHPDESAESYKRKVPQARQGSGLSGGCNSKEIHIRLHKDLEQFRPHGCLPEVLIRKYAKAVKSVMNPCSAIVPYTPPIDIVSEILQKERASVSNNNDAKSTAAPADDSSMDLDE